MERQAARVKNRVKPATVYPVIAGYFLAVTGLYGVMEKGGLVASAALATVLYLGAAMLGAWMVYQYELGKLWSTPNQFKRHLPFRTYGTVLCGFQHVFYAEPDALFEVQRFIKRELVQRGLARHFRVAFLADSDEELTNVEARPFCLATATTGPRSAAVTVAIHPQEIGQTQCISWWVMAAGFVDQDRVFRFVTFAPLTLPFWLAGYLRNEVDIIAQVRNLHSSFYRDLDIVGTVRALHDSMHHGLVSALTVLGVDTSDLKSGISFVTPAATQAQSVTPDAAGFQVEPEQQNAPAALPPQGAQAPTFTSAQSPMPSEAVPGSTQRSLPPPSGSPAVSERVPVKPRVFAGLPEDEEPTQPMLPPLLEPLLQRPALGQASRLSSAVYRRRGRAA